MNDEKYVQIHNGNIVLDRMGLGKNFRTMYVDTAKIYQRNPAMKNSMGLNVVRKKQIKREPKILMASFLLIQQKRCV